MAIIFKPKYTATTGKVPTTADLADGEFCVNTTDGVSYVRMGTEIKVVGRASADVGAGAHGEIYVSGTGNSWWEINSGAVTTNKIADNNVTLSKIQDSANNTILGNAIGYAESPQALTVAQVKTMLALTNVNDTTDAAKPVSTAQQTALNLKANLAAPALTGIPTAPTAAALTNTTQLATTAFVTTAGNLKANLAGPTFTGVPAAPTAAALTNTTQLATTAFVTTAGNLKANLASPTFTGTVGGITKAMVGLGSVDNTTDAGKPVSTAQQTALNLKASTGATVQFGDVTTYRAGAPTTGYFYAGNTAARYLGWDGAKWVIADAGGQRDILHTGNFDPATKANLASPTFTGTLTTPSVTVTGGGTYQAGAIFSNANWGMILRMKQASPTVAEFSVRKADDTALFSIDADGTLRKGEYGTGNAIYHTGNFDPAAKVNTSDTSAAASANTVVRRSADGYVFASYFNTNADVTSTYPSAVMVETGGDGYIRKKTMASFQTDLAASRFAWVANPAAGGMATATGSLGAIEIQASGTGTQGAAMISFHRTGNHAQYFGLDTDNQWKVGGWSAGAVAHKIWHEGNFNPVAQPAQTIGGGPVITSETGTMRVEGTLRTYYRYQTLSANYAVWVTQPRTFVQSTDPGAQADENDLWVW